MAISIRRGNCDEYPYAAQLRQDLGREMDDDFDAIHPQWRQKFTKFFAERQARGMAQLLLACDGEAVIGCGIISIVEDYRLYALGRRVARINSVYVKPAFRRRGIARALMESAMAWAREKNCVRITLRASDEGRLLYEKLGFETGPEMTLDL